MKKAPRRVKRAPGVTFARVCQLASVFPGVEVGLSWGTPGLKVKGRFLARMKEDGESLVLRMDMLQRERLMKKEPQTFYITDHYAGYPAVLVRLAKVKKDAMRRIVEDAWRYVA